MFNQLIAKSVPLMPKPIVRLIASKYIAGEHLSDAIKLTQDFAKLGGATTIDVLGEFVTSKERALQEKLHSIEVIEAIFEYRLPSYLSIKPTSLGLGIDYQFGYDNIHEIVAKAKLLGVFVRLDMENSPYTDNTLKLYKQLRAAGFDNVGVVIQAYMKRSKKDVEELLTYNASIRLCKGIYVEHESIAIKDREQIRTNYKELFDMIIKSDCNLRIATHDDDLINYALNYIKKNNVSKDKYEFEMLLGVRENKRNEILNLGHPLRIYVPFGEDWYGYSIRRVNENPDMAGHIFKAIFSSH